MTRQSTTEAGELARYYDGIAEVYEDQVFAKVQRYDARVRTFLRAVADRRGTRVLDVGCGPGHLTHALPPEVEVVGIDLSAEMLRVARQRRPGGTYRVHDYHQPLPAELGTFDVILAVGCLEFCNDLGGVVEQLARVARPRARLLLTVVERGPREGDDRARVPISPKLPGVRMYRYTYEEVARAIERARLDIMTYGHHPGWVNGEDVVDYGIWDLTRREPRT